MYKPTNIITSSILNFSSHVQPSFTYEAGLPNGCLTDKDDCEYYLRMGPNSENSNYVDIHLEGTLDGGIGWIAVGFSLDQLMVSECEML